MRSSDANVWFGGRPAMYTLSPTLATPLSCFSLAGDKPLSDCSRLRFSSRGESKELEPGVVESEHEKVGAAGVSFYLIVCGLSVLEFLSVISADSTEASGRRCFSVLLFCCCFKYCFSEGLRIHLFLLPFRLASLLYFYYITGIRVFREAQ